MAFTFTHLHWALRRPEHGPPSSHKQPIALPATLGKFSADMVVNESLIVENKSVRSLVRAHEVQVVNYLTATGIDEGLLLNYGGRSLEHRKKFRQRLDEQSDCSFQ